MADGATTELEAPTIEQELPAAPDGDAAKPDAKAEKPKKDGKKESKKSKKGAEVAAPGDGPSLAAHPRAVRSVARSKSWGGLIGFMLGGYLSLPTSTLAEAGLRALAAGVVCYVAAWAGAVFIWRRLVILEIKAREQELVTAMRAARSGAGQAPPAAEGRPRSRSGA
jgi:hypothetical protein